MLLLLVSGRGNQLEVEQFAPENIYTGPQKESRLSSSPIHFFQELFCCSTFGGYTKKKRGGDFIFFCF